MTVHQQIQPAPAFAVPEVWRTHLAVLAIVAVGLITVFFRDAADMATIWWNSSTYTHCLLILPIIGWLVWQRKDELLKLTPAASLWGVPIVATGAVCWMLGEAMGVSLFRHAGLVFMVQGSVISVLGLTVTRGLLFPLFYAIFLIPFGDEIVPALQMVTAELSMILLGISGLPAHIEGIFITTPSGLFRVAEACSGVKFLVAMIALGALTANLCFASWNRRIAFMATCVIVPIIANGIRAFGTIYIADISGIEFAESFDHVVYGWIFFAVVIAIIYAMNWRFFDRDIDDVAIDGDALRNANTIEAIKPIYSAAIIIGIAVMAQFLAPVIAPSVNGLVDDIPVLGD